MGTHIVTKRHCKERQSNCSAQSSPASDMIKTPDICTSAFKHRCGTSSKEDIVNTTNVKRKEGYYVLMDHQALIK